MFKVLNDNVIIKKNRLNENGSNIILKKNETNNVGIVVNIKTSSIIKEGNKIIFDENKSVTFQYNNEDFLFINEKDIIAIIE